MDLRSLEPMIPPDETGRLINNAPSSSDGYYKAQGSIPLGLDNPVSKNSLPLMRPPVPSTRAAWPQFRRGKPFPVGSNPYCLATVDHPRAYESLRRFLGATVNGRFILLFRSPRKRFATDIALTAEYRILEKARILADIVISCILSFFTA